VKRLRRLAIPLILAIGGFQVAWGATPALASPGSLLRSITVSPAPSCDGFDDHITLSVGVAFDGKELLVSCSNTNAAQNEIITRVDPSTGANLGTYVVSGMIPGEGIGAMSWDGDVGQLWIGTANALPQRIYSVVLDKTLGTGVATFRFSHAADGIDIVDGLAYDGTDKSIWMSPDVSDTIYHYTLAGVLLGSQSGLRASLNCPFPGGNSGIAVASTTTLYLSTDGCSTIYTADKAFTSFTLFASTATRLEDLECDNVDFAPLGALWSKDAYDWELRAFEAPADQCAPGGDPAIKAAGANLNGTEGSTTTGTVATFTDPDPASTAAEYTATIDWGDTTTSAGVISGAVGGPFTVTGSHAYQEEGSYTLTVKITDVDNPGNTATATSTATIGDAALAAVCAAPAAIPMSYSGPTAGLSDANHFGTTADFTATINWGDTSSSAGTVTGPMGGPYVVSGSHSYAAPGPYTITTTINDDGGSSTTASCSVTVFVVVAGGSFVIGDGNAALGTNVTFWGAQWSKLNTLSGGSAPAAFKGFEDTPSTAACGTQWSTDPGNSTPPPPGPLPAFMAVVVSSSISQSGSTISGDTVHIVVVRTNPGYQPNPGHAGTGTVVAQIC